MRSIAIILNLFDLLEKNKQGLKFAKWSYNS